MDFVVLKEPFPHIIIKNYFNEEELKKVWSEIDFYNESGNFLPPEKLNGWICPNQLKIKKNNGLYLSEFYQNKINSPLVLSHGKIFNDDFYDKIEKEHWFFSFAKVFNCEQTLVSYYEDGDYYKPHFDRALVTCITHLYREPKRFSGGDFCFPDYDYNISLENNRMIIFPSIINHEAKKVKMEEEYRNQKLGRYTISIFTGVKL